MIHTYCITLGEWFTIIGATCSFFAIVAALFIAFYQERKNCRRINEENKNIGESICALIEELDYLVSTLVTESYQVCIEELENDATYQPRMKLVTMTGIKKLDHFNPDILYRVFKYYKLPNEDYKNFILSIDTVISHIETGRENYKQAMKKIAGFKNEFQEDFKELVMITHDKIKGTDDPICIGLSNIFDPFITSRESYENIRYQKEELVDQIYRFLVGKHLNDKELMDIFNKSLELSRIFNTIQSYNKEYKASLIHDTEHLNEAMGIITAIHVKLKGGCKQ